MSEVHEDDVESSVTKVMDTDTDEDLLEYQWNHKDNGFVPLTVYHPRVITHLLTCLFYCSIVSRHKRDETVRQVTVQDT